MATSTARTASARANSATGVRTTPEITSRGSGVGASKVLPALLTLRAEARSLTADAGSTPSGSAVRGADDVGRAGARAARRRDPRGAAVLRLPVPRRGAAAADSRVRRPVLLPVRDRQPVLAGLRDDGLVRLLPVRGAPVPARRAAPVLAVPVAVAGAARRHGPVAGWPPILVVDPRVPAGRA